MKVEYCKLNSFSVIGKEGSSKDKPNFVEDLWNEANSHFNEIQSLVKTNEEGYLDHVWGLMSDFSHKLLPWENNFKEGLYLVGAEVDKDAICPEGWVKWDIPEREYLYVEVENGKYFDVFGHMVYYMMDFMLYDFVGAACDYTDLKTNKTYIYFPVKKRQITVNDTDETSRIARCGNHCAYCFFNKCGGCETDSDFCSYRAFQPDKKCENIECSKAKNIKGCYECLLLEKCQKGFFEGNNQTAKVSSIFIQREGIGNYEKVIKKMIKHDINYSKVLSDLPNDEERLKELYKYL